MEAVGLLFFFGRKKRSMCCITDCPCIGFLMRLTVVTGMKKDTVTLDFEEAVVEQLIDKNIRDGISSIARTGKYLWVAGDENISIQRLELLEDGSYGKAVNFFLKDYIELISKEEEADIEGMDVAGGYLWLAGSHSYKRKKMREGKDDPRKEIDRLTITSLGANRNLLARIPVIENENGEFVLVKECPDPSDKEKKLTAAKLKHTRRKWSQLTKKLRKDRHLGPFIGLPGKDNGLDIEGLTVIRDKVFLGLRGPVLRGWAIVLEIELEESKNNLLKLKKDKEGRSYKKHFLNLHGMGIRELASDGDDLIILAGPTMDLDGTMEIYRWENAAQHEGDMLVERSELRSVIVLPYYAREHGINKAEGIAILDDNSILITYDSPGEGRTQGEYKVKADVFSAEEEEEGS